MYQKKYWIFFYLLILLWSCTPNKDVDFFNSKLQSYLQSIHFDTREDVCELTFDVRHDTVLISGYTTLNHLDTLFKASSFTTIYQVVHLPDTSLQHPHGIVSLSLANIREQPGYSSEMLTQLLMGTPVRILQQKKGWLRIQTPERYLGWVQAASVKLLNTSEYLQWKMSKKGIFNTYYNVLKSDNGDVVSDIVMGSLVEMKTIKNQEVTIVLPNGLSSTINKNNITPYPLKTGSAEEIINLSKTFLGFPYVWGGTSVKGMDCSGFMKMLFYMNNILLLRDASQQAKIGEDIGCHIDNLKPCDLLFFGQAQTDTTQERITHVGMCIGNSEYIHSAGCVKINSLDSLATNFDSSLRQRFVRARRILTSIGSHGIELISDNNFYQP